MGGVVIPSYGWQWDRYKPSIGTCRPENNSNGRSCLEWVHCMYVCVCERERSHNGR
jgi:hypothetical protein